MADLYLGTIALTSLYVLSILGWGGLLSRLLQTTSTFWQDLAIRLVAGCSLLYALFIALSLVGLLHSLEVIVVVGLGMVLACAEIPNLARKANLALTGVKTWSRGDKGVAVVVGLYAALQMVSGLTPLMFYDLQAYQFLAPAQFLMSGDLSHIPWNVLTNTPLAMQMTLGMSLSMDPSGQVAKLIFAVLGCLAAVGVYEFVRPAGLRGALLAAACALSFPEFLLMQTLGAIDLSIAGLMIFGTIWARRGLVEGSWRLAVLAGLAFGLAVGSRYQAVILVCWIIVVLVAEVRVTRLSIPSASLLRGLLIIGALVAVLPSPWVVRNYVHLGNPVFPLMSSVWNITSEWSPVQMEAWNIGAFGPPWGELSAVQQILAPIGALLLQPSNNLFGMALLLAALVGIALSKSQIRLASFLGLSGLIIWGLLRPGAGNALLRYNAVSLLFLLAVIGAILGREWIPSSAGTSIALALSSGSLAIGILHVQSILPAAQSLVNVQARLAIHQQNVPSWEAFKYINERLDRKRDRVLLIGETRGFWLRIPYIAPSAFNGPQLDQIFGGDSGPDSWMREFSRLGLTHLLISNSEIERWHKQYRYLNLGQGQAEKMSRWLQTLHKVFDDGRGTVVLALAPVSQD